MFKVKKMPVRCDLAEIVFTEACSIIGVLPSPLVTLHCSIALMDVAIHLRGKFGVSIILVPSEILVGGCDAWAVNCGTSWVWSEGC